MLAATVKLIIADEQRTSVRCQRLVTYNVNDITHHCIVINHSDGISAAPTSAPMKYTCYSSQYFTIPH